MVTSSLIERMAWLWWVASSGASSILQNSAVVTTQAVEEAIGVALVERELHDVGTEHGFGREAGVAAVLVRRVECFDQVAGMGEYSPNHSFEETEAAFRWLIVTVGRIRIDFAHEDFSEGLRGQSTAWRSSAGRSTFLFVFAAHIILRGAQILNRKQGG